jgi:hypothetical protein
VSAPLLTIRDSASDEEVAALVAAVQALATAAASAAPSTPVRRAEWGAPHRRVRATFPAGPGGWRASSLPR